MSHIKGTTVSTSDLMRFLLKKPSTSDQGKVSYFKTNFFTKVIVSTLKTIFKKNFRLWN